MSTSPSPDRPGVSFVVPVHNGAAWIRETVASIAAQADGRPMEILVVDDHSQDDSPAILESLAAAGFARVLRSATRGASAAINTGIRAARFPIVCQVDQDVSLAPGWMARLLACFEDPRVGAAQGYYESDRSASFYSRLMGLDLEQRYAAIAGRETDHVCTGNSAYRTAALREVGLFDESMGYGYDNDMSYRLRDAGYRLVFARDARSTHRWREGLGGYLRQQYGFGYGRLDLVAKHPRRLAGDAVSPPGMMAHPLLALVAAVLLAIAALVSLAGGPSTPFLLLSGGIIAGLAIERLAAGIAAARRFRTAAPLAFPLLHLARDLAWVAAIVIWILRRAASHPPLPGHSMQPGARFPEAAARQVPGRRGAGDHVGPARVLCIIPAHNEAGNLPTVVAEMRLERPDLDIVIIDDGSTDATSVVAEGLNVRTIRFPERLGIGNAVRAGLRYAARGGYTAAVRIDGDGQHRARDIGRLLAPVLDDRADVVFGSRFVRRTGDESSIVRVLQRLLAISLSAITGNRVTDPTSGFCAFGRRAIRLLAEQHPTGYPEPELLLLLSRSGLTTIEKPVEKRPRLSGRTSLTPRRIAGAVARVMLAMVIVPLRAPSGEAAGD